MEGIGGRDECDAQRCRSGWVKGLSLWHLVGGYVT